MDSKKPISFNIEAITELAVSIPITTDTYYVERDVDESASIILDKDDIESKIREYLNNKLDCDVLKLDWE